MSNAAIYARVSTAQQEDGTSLETQVAACRRLAVQQGSQTPEDLVFRESGSGVDTDRRLLTELRDLARRGKVQSIYVYSPDRLSRNPLDLMILTEEFSQAGIPLVFVQGPSGDAAEDKLIRYILGYVGEKERAQIAERTTRGKLATARNGRMPTGTGKGLYGYRYDSETKRRSILEYEAEIVRRVFTWAAEGMSFYGIATRLNAHDIPTKGGNQWHPLTVRRLLTNEAYTGVNYYGRTRYKKKRGGGRELIEQPADQWIRIEGFTPRIIDDETFSRAQHQARQPKALRTPKTTPYLLTGFASCGLCGGPLVGAQMHGRYRYYRCRATGPTTIRAASCHAKFIRADALESAVWEKVNQVLTQPEIVLEELRRQMEGTGGDLDGEMSRLRSEIRHCRDQEQRLITLYLYGEIDDEYIRTQSGPIKILRERHQEELQRLTEQQAQRIDLGQARSEVETYCRKVQDGLAALDFDEKRAAFSMLHINAIATKEQVVVKGFVPSDIPTIEQTSA